MIGLTTYRETAAWGVWNEPADVLPRGYADSVVAAGGAPVLLPPAAGPAEGAEIGEDVVAALDGLVLTGGADVDPARYRAVRDEATGPARPDRDGWEIALVHAALRRDLPVLAICRGMQVLNVALGGNLIQHLPDAVGHDGHCPTVGEHGRHAVRLDPSSLVGALLGEQSTVATYHHQAIDSPAPGLTTVGWAEDGTAEAIVHADSTWVVGVQWHPEKHDEVELFTGLVTAALACRDARAGTVG